MNSTIEKKELYQELKDCYDQQAEHFHHTRKKYWQEIDRIRDLVLEASQGNESYHVVELGCGSGRLYPKMKEALGEKLWYIGSDNAPGMIHQAHTTYA